MQSLLERLQEKVEAINKKQDEADNADPLEYSIDLMALSDEEVDKFQNIFQKIDVTNNGRVSMNEFFDYFEETPTVVAQEILKSFKTFDEDGLITFGKFMKAIGTFCFFGKEEILRYGPILFICSV